MGLSNLQYRCIVVLLSDLKTQHFIAGFFLQITADISIHTSGYITGHHAKVLWTYFMVRLQKQIGLTTVRSRAPLPCQPDLCTYLNSHIPDMIGYFDIFINKFLAAATRIGEVDDTSRVANRPEFFWIVRK